MAEHSQQKREVPEDERIHNITQSPIEQGNQQTPNTSSKEMHHASGSMHVTCKGVKTHPGYDTVAALVAGSAQVIIGGLLIILGIAIAIVSKGEGRSAHPIWGGIIIVVAGAFAIVSAKTKRRDCIIVTLAVTAFGIILDIVFLAVGAIAIREYKKASQAIAKITANLTIVKNTADDLIALWALVILFTIIHFVFVVVQVIYCGMALRQTCVTRAPPPTGQVYANDCIPTPGFVNMGSPTAAGTLGPIRGGSQPCISLPLPTDPQQSYTITYGPDKSGVKGCYFMNIVPAWEEPPATPEVTHPV